MMSAKTARPLVMKSEKPIRWLGSAGSFFVTEGSGPGVSDETVKMAFIYTDLERTANALDFEVPDYGDYEAQVTAIADWVNANGGIGGRDLEPVVRVFEALQDTPSTEEELCNGITQDDQVFAVVVTGQFQHIQLRPGHIQNR